MNVSVRGAAWKNKMEIRNGMCWFNATHAKQRQNCFGKRRYN